MATRKRPATQAAISLTHPNAAEIDILCVYDLLKYGDYAS